MEKKILHLDIKLENILLDSLYTDFVRVEPDKAGGGIRFTLSLLPEGVRKISNDVGVERIPEGVEIPTRQEILFGIIKMFEEKGFKQGHGNSFLFSLREEMNFEILKCKTKEEEVYHR